jgi:hypothetical protein
MQTIPIEQKPQMKDFHQITYSKLTRYVKTYNNDTRTASREIYWYNKTNWTHYY